MSYCHAHRPASTGGFMVCTLLADHGGTFHIDTVHNLSWPMVTAASLVASLHDVSTTSVITP